MSYHANIHVQPECEKQKENAPQVQSQKTSNHGLNNFTNADLQYVPPADILTLQRTIGNRTVAGLMQQREEENVQKYSGSWMHREDEDELQYPGPRSTMVENNIQTRGVSGPSSSPAHRASPSSSATGHIGDATDLDGEALYGWDRPISGTDVATVVNGVIPTISSEEEMPRIVIFSGTHGNAHGNLINDATSRGFVAEDQATANTVNAANPGIEVEVIDVVESYREKSDLTAVYGMKNYIRILGWCYSKRSYGLGDSIKSNWWPAPDNI